MITSPSWTNSNFPFQKKSEIEEEDQEDGEYDEFSKTAVYRKKKSILKDDDATGPDNVWCLGDEDVCDLSFRNYYGRTSFASIFY